MPCKTVAKSVAPQWVDSSSGHTGHAEILAGSWGSRQRGRLGSTVVHFIFELLSQRLKNLSSVLLLNLHELIPDVEDFKQDCDHEHG